MLNVNNRTENKRINDILPVSTVNAKKQRTIDVLSHIYTLTTGTTEDFHSLQFASAIRYTTNAVPSQEQVNTVGKLCLLGNCSGVQSTVRTILSQMNECSEKDDNFAFEKSSAYFTSSPSFHNCVPSLNAGMSGFTTPTRSVTPNSVRAIASDISPIRTKSD